MQHFLRPITNLSTELYSCIFIIIKNELVDQEDPNYNLNYHEAKGDVTAHNASYTEVYIISADK